MSKRGPKGATHRTCTRCDKTLPIASFELGRTGKRRVVCGNCRIDMFAKRRKSMGSLKMGPLTLGAKWRLRKPGHDHMVYTHPLPSYGDVVTKAVCPYLTGKTLDELRDRGYVVEAA